MSVNMARTSTYHSSLACGQLSDCFTNLEIMPIRLAHMRSHAADRSKFPVLKSISSTELSTDPRSIFIVRLLYMSCNLSTNLSSGYLAFRSQKIQTNKQLPKEPLMSNKVTMPQFYSSIISLIWLLRADRAVPTERFLM